MDAFDMDDPRAAIRRAREILLHFAPPAFRRGHSPLDLVWSLRDFDPTVEFDSAQSRRRIRLVCRVQRALLGTLHSR